jgi:hypothetical protein
MELLVSIEDYAPVAIAEYAREWVIDCVPNPEDVEDASDDDVMEWARRHYDGGIMALAADAYASAGFDVLAATLRDTIRAETY